MGISHVDLEGCESQNEMNGHAPEDRPRARCVKLADVFEAPPGPPLLLVRLQRCGTFCEQFVKLAHHLGRYQRLHLMEAFEAEFHESLGFLGHVLDWVELLSQSLAAAQSRAALVLQ